MPGVEMARGAKRIEIPFERQGNFIIVKVVFQGLFPLKFIIDTGAEHTILTKKELPTLLGIPFERTINLMGTDMKTQVIAHIVRKVKLQLPNVLFTKDIIVLDDDYFEFDKFAGLDVHGVIGSEAFRGFIVKFDFSKQLITLYDPSVFKHSDKRNFEELPVQIIRSKPYIITQAQINNDSSSQLKLLLDTGAALSLLLHTYSTPGLSLPPQVIKGNIGTGLGGEIEGFVGRIKSLKIGSNTIVEPISNFQELESLSDSTYLNGRNGLIGGEVLCRFNFIIDFNKEKLYVQPNRYFKYKFSYDKSGLLIVAGGANLTIFTVHEVLPNSPASEAGLQKGDEFVSINRIPCRYFSLGEINRKMQSKSGRTYRIVFLRNGKKQRINLTLRDLI
ncbi:MAG: aspartyl protease family protein [Saprospiraceae bacterium]|nr:aspartyl protease family protein [Saprospiraceae bacterium]